jgi:putative membrane protein
VERRDADLVIKRGVLERREIAIPVGRVQAVRIVESLARQPFGFATLYVESAGHAEEKGASTMLHPFLHRAQWEPLLRELLPELRIDLPLRRPPRRALARFFIKPLLTTLAAGSLAALFVPYGWLALLALFPVTGLAFLTYRDTGLGVSEHIAIARSRTAERQTVVLARRCIQFASTSRSWLQRNRQLATVDFGAASGSGGKHFVVRDLDEHVADRFLTWVSPACDGERPILDENAQ